MTADGAAGALADPARLKLLAATRLLDSAPEEVFDRLTRLTARLFGVPVAMLSFLDDKRQFFKSVIGLGEQLTAARGVPLKYSICQHVVQGHAAMMVDDARQHPLLKDTAAVTKLGMVAYVGVPLLIGASAQPLGVLCAADHKPRSWTAADQAALEDLAAGAVSEIELRLAADALRDQTELMHAVLDDMADAVIAVDTTGAPILHNRAALALFGGDTSPIPPSQWSKQLGLFQPDGVTLFDPDKLPLVRAMRGTSSDGVEAFIRSPAHPEGVPTSTSARPLRRADGSLRGGVSVIRDMTMQRRATEALTRHAQDMRGQATIDELTGLGNRRGFVNLAGRQLQAAQSSSRPVLLLLAEIADLPRLEQQGQDAVDAAVVELAWLLNEVFRDSDVVARLRENEFAALTPGLDDAEVLLGRVRRRLAERNAAAAADRDLPRAPLQLTLAVVAHGHGESIEALLVRADAELHLQRERQATASAG